MLEPRHIQSKYRSKQVKFPTIGADIRGLYGAPAFHKRIESVTNSLENHSPYHSNAELKRKDRILKNSNSVGSLRMKTNSRNSFEVFLPTLKNENNQ